MMTNSGNGADAGAADAGDAGRTPARHGLPPVVWIWAVVALVLLFTLWTLS